MLAGDHEEAAEWAEYVRQLFVGRFLCCLGYQGDNNEGISYWGYGLGFVIDYADLLKAVCAIDLYQHPWLNQTARFPMYCAPPNAWAVSFADTGKPNQSVRDDFHSGKFCLSAGGIGEDGMKRNVRPLAVTGKGLHRKCLCDKTLWT